MKMLGFVVLACVLVGVFADFPTEWKSATRISMKYKWEDITPEERAAMKSMRANIKHEERKEAKTAKRTAWARKTANMTPEEKAEARVLKKAARVDKKSAWANMKPEEIAAVKAARKAVWKSMTPEDKDATKAWSHKKATWKNMTPKEKATAKAELKAAMKGRKSRRHGRQQKS